jgi:DNA-binding transcriptional LysR family regulator
MQVEVRHLRAFVAVAEELNFTRAAERLHLAQQALSTQIQQLEQRMDAQLFVRTSRRVELTAAGHALMAQAPALLSALDGAVETARQAARGEAGNLTVGLLATAALDLTPKTLRAFAADRPRVKVSLRNVSFDEPTGGVATGEADVALVWQPFSSEGLAIEPLYDDPRLAVMASDHPLAQKSELHAAELIEYPMGWIEELDPVARDFWTLADWRPRDRPPARVPIQGFDEMFAGIRSGTDVAAVPESISGSLPWTDVVTRPVVDLPPATVAVCWREHEPNALVDAFVDAARRVRDGSV